MERCPACGSERIYPSRLRSAGERLRHLITGMRPYRCHHCNWRRWRRMSPHTRHQTRTMPDELRAAGPRVAVQPSELDRLDP